MQLCDGGYGDKSNRRVCDSMRQDIAVGELEAEKFYMNRWSMAVGMESDLWTLESTTQTTDGKRRN